MSVPLKDFRLGITEEIAKALKAESRAFGKDQAAVARHVLSEWASRKAHEFRVREALERGETLGMEDDGVSRSELARAGVAPLFD